MVQATLDGLPATVVVAADAVEIALTPTVAVIVVESPAWLLGAKDVVAVATVAPEAVVVEDGVTVAVNPAVGAVVTLKVMGTPGWFVLSVAVTVDGALPATN
jgi:hypothetical protein